jgi:hypothetical protein
VDYRSEKNYWIPYSIGCVWSYSAQFKDIQDNIDYKDIFFKRDNHEDILKLLQSPDICAFSCYQWNKTYNKNGLIVLLYLADQKLLLRFQMIRI